MESLQETLSRLKFISRIPAEEKVNVARLVTQPNTWTTTFVRTLLEPDNRHNTLTFVTQTIKRCFDIVGSHRKSPNVAERALCVNIIADMVLCVSHGLRNLQATYAADLKFVCDLETLIDTTVAQLDDVFQADPALFPAEYAPRKTARGGYAGAPCRADPAEAGPSGPRAQGMHKSKQPRTPTA